MSFVPNFEERMKEELERSKQSQEARQRTNRNSDDDAPYGIKVARTAYEEAKSHYQEVNNPNHATSERFLAKEEMERKEKDYQRLSKTYQEATRKTTEEKREYEINQQQKQKEAEIQLRASYLDRWKAGGGDEQGFNASWEAIKAEHYKKAMFEQGNALENSLRAGSAGIL